MESTNLLRLRLQKYFFPFPEQVLKRKLSEQGFNRKLSKVDKYNILSALVLCRLFGSITNNYKIIILNH